MAIEKKKPLPVELTDEHLKVLTPQIRRELEQEAEEQIRDEQIAIAKAAFLEAAKKKSRQKHDPNERLYAIRIDLPDSSPCITINGHEHYFPQQTYQVNAAKRDCLMEIMWRSSLEDAVRRGNRHDNEYRRTLQRTISGNGMTLGNSEA